MCRPVAPFRVTLGLLLRRTKWSSHHPLKVEEAGSSPVRSANSKQVCGAVRTLHQRSTRRPARCWTLLLPTESEPDMGLAPTANRVSPFGGRGSVPPLSSFQIPCSSPAPAPFGVAGWCSRQHAGPETWKRGGVWPIAPAGAPSEGLGIGEPTSFEASQWPRGCLRVQLPHLPRTGTCCRSMV